LHIQLLKTTPRAQCTEEQQQAREPPAVAGGNLFTRRSHVTKTWRRVQSSTTAWADWPTGDWPSGKRRSSRKGAKRAKERKGDNSFDGSCLVLLCGLFASARVFFS